MSIRALYLELSWKLIFQNFKDQFDFVLDHDVRYQKSVIIAMVTKSKLI